MCGLETNIASDELDLLFKDILFHLLNHLDYHIYKISEAFPSASRKKMKMKRFKEKQTNKPGPCSVK